MLKFKCLILDHDDTCVDSTRVVHYPAHREAIKTLRPNLTPLSLDNWYLKNFHPGIGDYLTRELGLSEEEVNLEIKIWRKYTAQTMPCFFPGIIDFLIDFKNKGGIITVVSHSEIEVIERHYQSNSPHLKPDLIFGWNMDKRKRKPNPWPVYQILDRFNLSKEDVIVLDDLKPGIEMAREAGVAAIGVGWGHQIPEIIDYMQENCLLYLRSVQELKEFIFSL